MDELELLKKDWKEREKDLPHLKASEIYPMLLRKSSSIVKWIFIISLIELTISSCLNIFLTDDAFWNQVEAIHLKNITMWIFILSYLVTFIFIYLFYKNYKRISTTDNASLLMENILKTRRVVKFYILWVLISTGVTSMVYFIFSIVYSPIKTGTGPEALSWPLVILIGIGVTVVLLALIWLVYSLLYGILLRKLKRNYKELKRLEF